MSSWYEIFHLSAQTTYLYLTSNKPKNSYQFLFLVSQKVMELVPSISDRVVSSRHILFYHSMNEKDRQQIKKIVQSLSIEEVEKQIELIQEEIIEIPVCYSHKYALDADRVEKQTQMKWEECINLHQNIKYQVISKGFRPGFAYLGFLPKELTTTRHSQPRKCVPQGSVAIAEGQTAIYPSDGPGGWNIIGRTYYKMWEKERKEPCLIQPYTKVQFKQISQEEYDEYSLS